MSATLQTAIIPKVGHVYVVRQNLRTFVPETQLRWDILNNGKKEIIFPVGSADCVCDELVMFLGCVKETEVIPEASYHAEYICLKLFLVRKSQIHYMKSSLIFAGDDEVSIQKRINHQFSLAFYTLEEYEKTKKTLQTKT